ncbi:hypothetical protein PHAVU_004G085094 [Phaseolus vulgaris]|uniref:Uncharacterized protein n=1 Tax=Phaseolus vulgaris TaxID=3885 RepID=V7C6L9_PHAVU|nr:hypothetical protein PHAVU_003G063600g [Phaseolus vulgaris]ESW25764.1 hypothetical protein PHAVU_003G063600g [Phaseolus vulgaris]
MADSVNKTALPLRPTYVNLYKWPESDVEFVKSVNSNICVGSNVQTKGVDSFSCRQMYLRSYKFSKKKVGVTEKTLKCFNKLKEGVACVSNKLKLKGKNRVLGRAKDVIAFSIFQTFLPCSAKVDIDLSCYLL